MAECVCRCRDLPQTLALSSPCLSLSTLSRTVNMLVAAGRSACAFWRRYCRQHQPSPDLRD